MPADEEDRTRARRSSSSLGSSMRRILKNDTSSSNTRARFSKMAPAGSPEVYFAASGCAAIVNYPLWKASAVAQSGFDARLGVEGRLRSLLAPLDAHAYKGLIPVVSGMTWARAVIFYGSDRGAAALRAAGARDPLLTTLPRPPSSSSARRVQLDATSRSCAAGHDPGPPRARTRACPRRCARSTARAGSRGCGAARRRACSRRCPSTARRSRSRNSWSTGCRARARGGRARALRGARALGGRSCAAALAGAVLTNPLDVIRNEMFKTDLRARRGPCAASTPRTAAAALDARLSSRRTSSPSRCPSRALSSSPTRSTGG